MGDEADYMFEQEIDYYAYCTNLKLFEPNYDIWGMKNGTNIKISDMTKEHLVNTIRMLERGDYDYKEGYISQMYQQLKIKQPIEKEIKIMSKENNAQVTKVITGKVRFSYVNVFKGRAFQPGQEEKFSICLLIPKNDKDTLTKIKAAVEAARKEGIANKWGGKLPANLKLPLRDGDAERAEEAEEYEGMFFVNANSNQKPGIIDNFRNEILDPTEVYSGCYGRASINFFPYNSNGSKGVAVGLNNIQKLSDGEPLGGARASAENDFGDDYADDSEDMLG